MKEKTKEKRKIKARKLVKKEINIAGTSKIERK